MEWEDSCWKQKMNSGRFWAWEVRAAMELKARWAAAFLKDFLRQGRNWVSPGLFTGSKSGACTWQTERSFLSFLRGGPCSWLLAVFQLKSCEFPLNWQAPKLHCWQLTNPPSALEFPWRSAGFSLTGSRRVQAVGFCWCKLFYTPWCLE